VNRITLVLVGLVAAALLGLGVALYVGVRAAAWQQHDAGLAARAQALSAITESEEEGLELVLPAMHGAFAEAWAADGTVLARSPGWQGDLPARTGTFDLTLPDGRAGRAFGMKFHPRDDEAPTKDQVLLVLAEGIEDVEAAGATVRTRFLVLGAIILALFAGVTAWLMARVQAGMVRERQFTADVSHELRTPLAGLRTLLEVSARSPRPEDAAAALAIVVQMCTLVENLLMLARLDAGQVQLARESVGLRALVEDCWQPYAATAAARGLTFKNELSGDAVATTDREKLRIILGNLLSNAAEYTEAGGWIAIAAPPGALVEVADSGPAIADTERIFDRMWRGDAARAATGIHCGIGLSLARSLAGVLALRLTCRSSDDGSVRFVVSSARA
jgi:anti-sigma regulatory factor (Ser/Thr protein kinase)